MKNNFFLLLLIAFALSGCRSQKEISYFQNIGENGGTFNKVIQQYEPKITSGDMLSIVVSAIDPTAAAPFNLPIVSYASPNSDQLYSQVTLQTYLVDKEGNIEFPVLGKLKIGGLLKSEAVAMLQKALEPHLKKPIVNIKITNYKVSVLGEVNRPGAFTIDNERVTFIDALALAGDLTIYGKRKDVMIFRENDNGEKTIAKIDLTTDQLFGTPYYYLQQNDIIYVEPNKTKAKQASYNPNVPIAISAVSTAASIAAIIFSIVK
ncbi:MAG: polysaccharide biosynthesis/export family protein [Prevotellaceae bacterium]|jgi:polysaccharide export outer membrane protein|nr:polysaccharide biosynthesis/export family protein [Prevotellaceae bacterium]